MNIAVRNFLKRVFAFIVRLLMKIFCLMKIKNKAVFISFDGKKYSDNPRAIYEKMISEYTDMEYIWILDNKSIKIRGAKVIKKFSILSWYHFATAKLWVSDSRLWSFMLKRKGQFYVQTWHGDVCLKRIEKDAEDSLPESYIKNAVHDSKMADLMISGSKFRTQNIRTAFWYEGEILECGTPKSDTLYMSKDKYQKLIRKKFKLNNDVKIALYVPTFREDSSLKYYNIDYDRLIKTLEKKFGGRWKIIVRLHPNISNKNNALSYNENILNGTHYQSADELIVGANLVITDYSGCMFHGLETGIPVVLYTVDIEEYIQDRGTYFSFDELPFPYALNNDELVRIIENWQLGSYLKCADDFKKKLGYFNSVNSTEKVVNEIMKRIVNI